MRLKHLILFPVLCFTVFSCKEEKPIEISSNDYHNAVDKLTQVMIHDIFSPPVASRIYAYPNIAAYETLNQNNASYRSLNGQLNDLTLNPPENADVPNLKLASIVAYLDVAKELVFSKDSITKYRDSLYKEWDDINSKE